MKEARRRSKVILIDTAGIILIIISPLLGWLPGPGGIPLFLAGLSLLALNHEWAARFQKWLIDEGFKLFRRIFNEHPYVQAAYDFFSAVLIITGIYLLNTYTQNFTLALALFCTFTGLALFLGNRSRLQRFKKWLLKR